MTETEGFPSDALSDIAYLSRSDNRVRVLDTLTDGTYAARELRDLTGTSKATLSRILNEFEERSWARRAFDGGYEATPQGEHVMAQLRPFVASMTTIRNLGEEVGVLPVDELTMEPDADLTVGLHHFDGAVVERQSAVAQGAGREYLADTLRETSGFHVLTDMAPPRVVGTILQDRADSGDLSGDHVWGGDLYEHITTNPDQPPRWSDLMAAGHRLYRYDGHLPANIAVADESAMIWGGTDEMRRRVIISQDDTVRSWARAVIDRYRERAEPVQADVLD